MVFFPEKKRPGFFEDMIRKLSHLFWDAPGKMSLFFSREGCGI